MGKRLRDDASVLVGCGLTVASALLAMDRIDVVARLLKDAAYRRAVSKIVVEQLARQLENQSDEHSADDIQQMIERIERELGQ